MAGPPRQPRGLSPPSPPWEVTAGEALRCPLGCLHLDTWGHRRPQPGEQQALLVGSEGIPSRPEAKILVQPVATLLTLWSDGPPSPQLHSQDSIAWPRRCGWLYALGCRSVSWDLRGLSSTEVGGGGREGGERRGASLPGREGSGDSDHQGAQGGRQWSLAS